MSDNLIERVARELGLWDDATLVQDVIGAMGAERELTLATAQSILGPDELAVFQRRFGATPTDSAADRVFRIHQAKRFDGPAGLPSVDITLLPWDETTVEALAELHQEGADALFANDLATAAERIYDIETRLLELREELLSNPSLGDPQFTEGLRTEIIEPLLFQIARNAQILRRQGDFYPPSKIDPDKISVVKDNIYLGFTRDTLNFEKINDAAKGIMLPVAGDDLQDIIHRIAVEGEKENYFSFIEIHYLRRVIERMFGSPKKDPVKKHERFVAGIHTGLINLEKAALEDRLSRPKITNPSDGGSNGSSSKPKSSVQTVEDNFKGRTRRTYRRANPAARVAMILQQAKIKGTLDKVLEELREKGIAQEHLDAYCRRMGIEIPQTSLAEQDTPTSAADHKKNGIHIFVSGQIGSHTGAQLPLFHSALTTFAHI